MADLIIDKEAFLRRIRKLYSFWKVNVAYLWRPNLLRRHKCRRTIPVYAENTYGGKQIY